MPWNSLSCADTAKLVRAALKATFPAVAFTVRSKTYSGGASITVGWTDGPSTAEVEKITHRFEGARMDGYADCKEYQYHARHADGTITPYDRDDGLPEGAEEVHLRADFIFTDREYTADFLQKVGKRTADYWGCPVPAVLEHPGYGAQYGRTSDRIGGGSFTADELASQMARKASRVEGGIVYPKN